MNDELIPASNPDDDSQKADEEFEKFVSENAKNEDMDESLDSGLFPDENGATEWSSTSDLPTAKSSLPAAGADAAEQTGEGHEPSTSADLLTISDDETPARETEEHPLDIDQWLTDTREQHYFHSILILKGSRVWKFAGDLSHSDLQAVEHIISETRNIRVIDMARYARLGPDQQKYLLYTTSISGSLILCTVNYSYRQLSEIRARTRECAGQLKLDEDRIEIPEWEEPPAAAEPARSIERKPVRLEPGEAAPVMLDDIIRQPAMPGDQADAAHTTDGWVFEHPQEPETVPERLSAAPQWTDQADLPAKEQHPDQPDTDDAAHTQTKEAEYGKPQETHSEALFELTGKAFLKPPLPGVKRRDHEQSVPGYADRFEKEFSGWKPVYTDIVPWKRGRLRNQKPSFQAKRWIQPIHRRGLNAGQIPGQGSSEGDSDLLEQASAAASWQLEEAEQLSEQENPVSGLPVEETLLPPEKLVSESGQPEPLLPLADEETFGAADELDDALFPGLQPAEALWPPENIPAGTPAAAEESPVWPGEEVPEPGISEKDDLLEKDDFLGEDEIFLDETSDFLKEFAQDSALEGMDPDQDATAFFEEYFNRSGEMIDGEPEVPGISDGTGETAWPEETETLEEAGTPVDTTEKAPPGPGTDEEMAGFDPMALLALEAADEIFRADETAPEAPALEDRTIDDADEDFLEPSAGAAQPEAPVTAESGPSAPPDGEEAAASAAPEEPPGADIFMENLPAAETAEDPFARPEPFTADGIDARLDTLFTPDAPAKPSAQTPEADQLAPLDIDADFNRLLVAMQERLGNIPPVQADQEPADETSRTSPPAVDHEADDAPWMTLRQNEPQEAPPGADRSGQADVTDRDLKAIISDALTDDEEKAPAAASDADGGDEYADLFKDEPFPWEVEGSPDNIEATPTPQSLAAAGKAEGLVDLLADTSLEPVRLSFDQPMYTCILVPELREFSLNEDIAGKIQEWLPRLSRVFGWQFENISIHPTYLQWTVRVPAGTSQSSIVRKVRQQTSLRIFETFPELKVLSPEGNFWAKGYLVVAGSNPPPAEFLDDFIQKNRRFSNTD